MPVIARLWLALAGHGWVVPTVLLGPTCGACPFFAGRWLNALLQARLRWPFRRGRVDVRLDDGGR
jgi:hypothetical protein